MLQDPERAGATRYPLPGRRAMPAEGNGTSFIPALWHEKALLFLRTPPRIAATACVGASTAVLSFLKILSRGYQCHIRERGLASGFEGAELTIWISLPYTFKEFRSPLPRFSSHSPPPPRPSNFPYFSSNRLARDSASCITGCSSPGLAASPLLCSRSRYSPRAILICLSFPCFRVCSRSGASRALKRGE